MKERPVPGDYSLPAYLLSLARIAIGLLFFQHGAEKLWGFAGGRIDHDFGSMRGFAGPLEVLGGALIVSGLLTRATAFILCGEMAVAYFRSWAPRGFFPIQNGGEEAVLFCYVYLWLVAAGGGVWSLDNLIARRPSSRRSFRQTVASWEPHFRSITRTIVGFMFGLHGLRLALGLLPALAGRRLGTTMALDVMPRFIGYWEIAAGILLFVGLFTRPTALISSMVAIGAYLYGAAPRGLWPIRNGGNEALLYAIVFAYLAVCGGGTWSLDRFVRRSPRSQHAAMNA